MAQHLEHKPHVFFVFDPKNSNYESIQQTARSIAEQAHVLAYDPNYMSPFAQFACDNGLNVRGKCLRWSVTLHCPRLRIFKVENVEKTFSLSSILTGLSCFLSRRKARWHHSAAVHSGRIHRLESVWSCDMGASASAGDGLLWFLLARMKD